MEVVCWIKTGSVEFDCRTGGFRYAPDPRDPLGPDGCSYLGNAPNADDLAKMTPSPTRRTRDVDDQPGILNFCGRSVIPPDDFGNGPLWLLYPLQTPAAVVALYVDELTERARQRSALGAA